MTSPTVKRAAYLLASSALALIAVFGASSASAFDYQPVTDERRASPEPEDWLQYRGNNQGWGYTP